MRQRVLTSILMVLLVTTACRRGIGPSRTLVNDGFDFPSQWRLDGCIIKDGVLVLHGAAAGTPSSAMRILPPLPDTGSLIIGVRTRATKADGALHIDLWGFGRDDAAQEMALQPSEIHGEFAPAGTVWPSGSSTQGIWLRVFSESSLPVEVDHISVVYVPQDLWHRVEVPRAERS